MPLFHQYSIELHNLVMAALAPNPCERYSSLEVLWGAIDEVELGVASDDIFEPLLPMKGQTDNGSAGSENVVKHLVVRSFEGNDSRGDDIEADTEACYKAREAQEDCVC